MPSLDYNEIWNDLEAQAMRRSRPVEPLLLRRLVLEGTAPEVHLGSDGQQLYILIRMPSGWNGDISSLPRWSGMRPGAMRGTERPMPRHFLVLRQEPGAPSEVFKAVAADICGSLVGCAPDQAMRVVSHRLGLWKVFFEATGAAALGIEAQQGLFGELWVLREHFLPKLGPGHAVSVWTGPKHSNHDFQLPRVAVEVKTSTAKQHQKIHIPSERQLDTRGLDMLNLVILSFSPLDHGGESLPQMVGSLRASLQPDPVAAREFEDKLIEAGYIDAHSERYGTGYSLRSERAFAVRPGFPCLLEGDLPDGVGDLSYTIALAACAPFEVGIAEMWMAVLGGSAGESR